MEVVNPLWPCMRDRQIVELVPDGSTITGSTCPDEHSADCPFMASCCQCMGAAFALWSKGHGH
jgi:hypothetical protein